MAHTRIGHTPQDVREVSSHDFSTGYQNGLTRIKKAETKAKVEGILKKLKDAKCVLNVCAAADILEKVRPVLWCPSLMA